MLDIKISREHNGSWTLTIPDLLRVSGFEEQREAAVWAFEYAKYVADLGAKSVKRQERREDRRKALGAALLSVPDRPQ
jgi:hypothetical protein